MQRMTDSKPPQTFHISDTHALFFPDSIKSFQDEHAASNHQPYERMLLTLDFKDSKIHTRFENQ